MKFCLRNSRNMNTSLMAYGTKTQRSGIQPGYHQNLSGSDTDVSTSTENLTAEEKCVLRNGIRQEPQGEETIADNADVSLTNTLIIHNNSLHSGPNSVGYGHRPSGRSLPTDIPLLKSDKNSLDNDYLQIHYTSRTNSMSSQYSPSKNNNSVPSSPRNNQRKNLFTNLQKSPVHASMQQFPLGHTTTLSYYPLLHTSHDNSECELAGISNQYLDQSDVTIQQQKDSYFLPSPPADFSSTKWPTPDYANILDTKSHLILDSPIYANAVSKSQEKFSVSRSHPNLTHVGRGCYSNDENCAKLSHFVPRPETHGRLTAVVDSESQASQMIDLLSSENIALKNELDLYYKKVSKLQKFELEILKVHRAHEDLVRSTEKREKLEKAVRMRLEMEIRHLQEQNKELKDHLQSATSHIPKRSDSNQSDHELSKREVLIAQLLTQNKELLAEKEQQEILLQAQRVTLQEQRNHIDILDNALTNAQANVMKLEEENRKKQVYVERVTQLQKALTSLQQSSERRLQMEMKVRLQLEKEVETLRQQKAGKREFPVPKGDTTSKESLQKTVLEYEKKIIALEAEVSKWEQRYVQESAMRQIAVDAASLPKDAKIAALERTSQESEKLIAQARSEKLKHMDELYAANRKCAELDGRIKDFESKLAEKDAMIKVLQHHSQSKDAVFHHTVLGRPPRHTRAASTVGLTTSTSHTTTTTGTSCFGRATSSPSNILHRRTGSKAEIGASGSLLSISSDSSSITCPSESSPVADSVTGSQKSLDEQLKELDSRLSSKDSIISALRAEKERYPSHFWRV